MQEAILSFGSNLGDRFKNLKKATDYIGRLPNTRIIKVSSIYETPPFGVSEEQNFYLNCCARIATSFSPEILMGCCLGIETALGRTRSCKNASRTIDIDLIFYEDLKINKENLQLPHPFWQERVFVVKPMMDICENDKVFGFDIKKFWLKCEKENIKKFELDLGNLL